MKTKLFILFIVFAVLVSFGATRTAKTPGKNHAMQASSASPASATLGGLAADSK